MSTYEVLTLLILFGTFLIALLAYIDRNNKHKPPSVTLRGTARDSRARSDSTSKLVYPHFAFAQINKPTLYLAVSVGLFYKLKANHFVGGCFLSTNNYNIISWCYQAFSTTFNSRKRGFK